MARGRLVQWPIDPLFDLYGANPQTLILAGHYHAAQDVETKIGMIHIVQGQSLSSAGVLGAILGSSFVVATHSPPGIPEDGEEIATTYSFRRRGPSGVGFETREFFIENRGPLGGTMVVTSMADIAKMTSTIVGGLITGATA